LLDRNQAEEISEAILERERQRLAKRKERRLRWAGYGPLQRRKRAFGVIGFGLGSIVGLICYEDWMPLAFAGMGLGFMLAWASGWFGKPFN